MSPTWCSIVYCARVGRRVGAAIAAHVGRRGAVARRRQRRHLVAPRMPRLRKAVAQQHQRPLALRRHAHAQAAKLENLQVGSIHPRLQRAHAEFGDQGRQPGSRGGGLGPAFLEQGHARAVIGRQAAGHHRLAVQSAAHQPRVEHRMLAPAQRVAQRHEPHAQPVGGLAGAGHDLAQQVGVGVVAAESLDPRDQRGAEQRLAEADHEQLMRPPSNTGSPGSGWIALALQST